VLVPLGGVFGKKLGGSPSTKSRQRGRGGGGGGAMFKTCKAGPSGTEKEGGEGVGKTAKKSAIAKRERG